VSPGGRGGRARLTGLGGAPARRRRRAGARAAGLPGPVTA